MKKTILFAAVLFCTAQAFSKVWTVRSSGGNYSSLTTAFANATSAIVSGDTIDVLGTFIGKVSYAATTPKTLVIQGHGVDSTSVLFAATQSPTAVSNGAVFNLDGDLSASNFTIKNMTIANANSSYSGGGVRVNNTGASNVIVQLTGLKITNNIAANGGGVSVGGRAVIGIANCNITANTATSTSGGGGIVFTTSTANIPVIATIKNTTISNNISSAYGGAGIAVWARGTVSTPSSLWIENSTIYGNSVTSTGKIGAGIYVKNVEALSPFALTLNHCTVTNNSTSAGVGGDGIGVDNNGLTGTTLVMNNSIVLGNSGSTSNISQVGVGASSTTSANIINGGISNSFFAKMTAAAWFPGTGVNNNNDITGTANMAFASGLSNDITPVLLIGAASAAKDFVVTDLLATPLVVDQIGNSRSGAADAGAYEYNPALAISTTAATGGTITAGATGTYASGASVTVTAAGTGDNVFKDWTIGGVVVSTSASYTFSATKALALVANFTIYKSVATLTPTVTYSRTANTIDVLVTNPVGYNGTFTYNVLDANNSVLASGVAASAFASTLVYSATGLLPNSTQTYKVVAVLNGTANSLTASLTALTRKFKNSSFELLEDFETGTTMGWGATNGSVVTVPFANPLNTGINTSANCSKTFTDVNKVNYCGLNNSKERIAVGPNAPYQYLHMKVYRDADNGTIGLTFLARSDISQIQFSSVESFTPSVVSATGPWVDYVFNLKDVAYLTDEVVFGFYVKTNRTTANTTVASNTYVDDIYLSNDATPSTASILTAIDAQPTTTGSDFVIVKGKELQFIAPTAFVQIYDVTGALVIAQKPLDGKVSVVKAGLYIVKMTTGQGVKVQKVLVK